MIVSAILRLFSGIIHRCKDLPKPKFWACVMKFDISFYFIFPTTLYSETGSLKCEHMNVLYSDLL